MPPLPGVGFFLTTRRHGYSQGGYAGLNLADHVGDDPATVMRNRHHLMAVLGMADARLCLLRQVHGVEVRDPANTPPGAIAPEGDALVTDRPGLVLGILVADCAPLLFADVAARVIGAAHAGWRGAIAGVVPATLQAMVTRGARREQITTIIGPCIGREVFVVGPEVRERFLQESARYQDHFVEARETGRFLLDLPGFLRRQLVDNGLVSDRIHHAHACTFSREELFFSHRRATLRGGEPCGRQMGGIYLA